jgi:pimeloyl-ACP methyl ester carboxylesterase
MSAPSLKARTLKALGGLVFRTSAAIAPSTTGRAAFTLFCLPPRASARDASELKLAEKLGPILGKAEALRVTTPDGEVQTYLWRTEQSPPRGRVLLVHGWTASALVMTLFVEPLRKAGFDVAAVDLPAHGQSTGRLLNMPLGARALLAVADQMGPFTGLVSHSFGGPIAALAVEGGSPVHRRFAVDRLVLISAPHALHRVTRAFGTAFGFNEVLQTRLADEVTRRAGRPIQSITTGDLLRVANHPVLIVQDDDDDVVPFADGRAIADAAGPLATLLTTKGLGHRRIVVMPSVVRAAVKFLSAGVEDVTTAAGADEQNHG